MHTLTALQDATLTVASRHHAAAYGLNQAASHILHHDGSGGLAFVVLIPVAVVLLLIGAVKARSN